MTLTKFLMFLTYDNRSLFSQLAPSKMFDWVPNPPLLMLFVFLNKMKFASVVELKSSLEL